MNELSYENIENIYTLTPMQEGMYFHYLEDKQASTYLVQISYHIRGRLDVDIVKKSIEYLFKRYEVLRTIFNHEKSDKLLQIVLKERKVNLIYEDIRNIKDKNQYILEFKKKDKNKQFDLNKDVLMRVAIIQTEENDYEFIWTHHHILMDGWCISKIICEFNTIYNSYLNNQPIQLNSTRAYKTYFDWLEKQDKKSAIDYWKKYLEGYDEINSIPWKKVKSKEGYKKEEIAIEFSDEVNEKLSKLAGNNQVTLSTIVQTIWGILLAKYNNKQDVIFGTVVSGRPPQIQKVDEIIGLFINTIPVRIKFSKNMSFINLVKKIQTEMIEGSNFHYSHLTQIQAESELKQKLIDHILVFENYPIIEGTKGIFDAKLTFEASDINVSEQTNYDFNILIQSNKNLLIKFQFNENVYCRDGVERIAENFNQFIEQILDNYEILIDNLSISNDEEKDKLLNVFNDTKVDIQNNKSICEQFEEQVDKTPDKVAIIFGNETLTYRQLNEEANKLAYVLIEKGILKGDIIGLCSERSLEMMIGIFGILKVGGVYLPIDPNYPTERINFILEDSNAKMILIQNSATSSFHPMNIEVLNLNLNEFGDKPKINIKINYEPTDLMYIIYTSGSTGLPKGVMIEHRSVINRINWMQRKYPIGPTDTLMQKTPITFDVSIWELFWWAVNGSSLSLLYPNEEKDPRAIMENIQSNNVTVIHFVPSMFNAFVDYVEYSNNLDKLLSLKQIFLSGEVLTVQHVKKFNTIIASNIPIKLTNLYGPTEATIDVSYFDCPNNEDINKIPIGKPIDNIKLYVLNNNELQPIGIPGELYISGIGVGRGYVNRQELTREKFIENPFSKNEIMYKTGDLAKWTPDGNIEFIGRIDRQVKIHGYRIELDEIENLINSIEYIKKSAVIIREINGNKSLLAYITSDNKIDSGNIKNVLSSKLPTHMIPVNFIQIQDIPLTSSGKINRKYLESLEVQINNEYKEPIGEIENKLAEIWAEVLGIPKISISRDANFFDIGGNSINIIYVASKIKKIIGKDISITNIFRYTTINSLAGYLIDENEEEIMSEEELNQSINLMEQSINFFRGADEDGEKSN